MKMFIILALFLSIISSIKHFMLFYKFQKLTTMKKSVNRFLLVATLFLFSAFAFGQATKTVTGEVKDASGSALPGVSVTEKGKNTGGAFTDDNGKFSISVGNNAVLILSYVGFTTKEVKVGANTNISVQMDLAEGQLSEVVVTSLGIQRQAKSLGYATATVKSEDITRAGSPNFAGALYGKAP